VSRISKALRTVLDAPGLRAVVAAQGAEAVWDTPDQFAAFEKQESAKWGKLIRDIGIKVE
jgi:tripartite-type tricarboxylate transporter receptor subunit TctC